MAHFLSALSFSMLTVPFNSNEVIVNSHSQGRLNPLNCNVKVRTLAADLPLGRPNPDFSSISIIILK